MTKFKTSTQTLENKRVVIGIDPGFDRIGVAILCKDPPAGGQDKLLYSVCIVTDRKQSPEKRLERLGKTLNTIIKKWCPESMAIEKLFFNQNVSTALKVAEGRGVILYEAAKAGLNVFEYSPQAVKIAVTGYGKASKKQMGEMCMRLSGLKKAPKYDDELDAIAVCITHLASTKPIWYK